MNARSETTRGVMQGGRRLLASLLVTCGLCLVATSPALAAPVWELDSVSNTIATPGGTLTYFVQLSNVGDADTDGSQISFVIRLPDGMLARSAGYVDVSSISGFPCFDARDGVSPVAGARSVVCRNTARVLARSGFQKAVVSVNVDAGASGTLLTELEISGGGAATVRAIDPVSISSALLPFGVDAFDGRVTADASGTPLTQAGGRPYDATVELDFNTIRSDNPLQGDLWPVETTKDVFVDLPPGLVGNPSATERCLPSQLAGAGGLGPVTACPAGSQVGITSIRIRPTDLTEGVQGPFPVYNVEPPPGVPARFGFRLFGTVITLDGQLRSDGDYGLTVAARNIPQALAIAGTSFTFWGVPAAPEHDFERACAGKQIPSFGGPTCGNGAPLRAFLRNPTSCTPPGIGLPVTARIDSWENPGVFTEATWISHLPDGYPLPPSMWGAQIGPTGCDRVPFNPTFRAQPLQRKAGSPSGFNFDLSLPQTDDPTVIAQADLKQAVVTLPLGTRVSPSSANGLGACSPAEIGLDDGEVPNCPDSSKIGSVTIDTPLLEEPLNGAVYLARPNDNPFGSLLSLYLVAEGPGVVVKLPGKVDADPISGQLTATFDDNPQLPFSNLHLEFKSGARAPLVLPRQCGTYTTRATLTSWSGKTVVSESSFTVDDGCASQFEPQFEAGTSNPVAGKSADFLLRLSRGDADEELSSLSLQMASGLTGRIADVSLCADAAANAGTCADASKIGDVTVGAGAGTSPFYITNGRVYLTGPYRGAPYGLAVVVPAVAGPFDLGLVTVRQALFVDKHTAEIRVVSDPFPTILQGIPLDVRDVRVAINRPGFFLNPTSCAEKTLGGTIQSVRGSSRAVSARFQVGECASLDLRPRMTVTVGGRGSTQRGRTTALSTTLRMPPTGQANLRGVKVTLPMTINARLTVINDACTRAEYEAANCEDARTGSATAVTPLLPKPLTGGVYFVRNGNPLPDLFVRLRGDVEFDLIGRITIPGSKRLRTTFDRVPDVPVSSFTLKLNGGRRGSVGNAANLCSARARRAKAELDYTGQNGKTVFVDQRLDVKGCRARRARGRRARRRGRR